MRFLAMQIHMARRMLWVLIAMSALVLFVSETPSQQRGRPSRRTTNPVRPQPAVPVPSPLPTPAPRTTNPADPTLISTADDQPAEQSTRRGARTRRNVEATESENEALRRTVNKLSTQVTALAEDLGDLRSQQRTLVDLERLTRAEQRAEGFRAQLRDVLEKEMGLQARMEQLDYELLPDNIQRRAALTGTFRPEELREQIRRQLESEKRRVQQQLDLLTTSRTRLEGAIANADTEVERLRARVEAAERETDATGTTSTTGTNTAAPAVAPVTPTTTTTTQSEPQNNIPR
ncbi:MAG TPA: hypothetical protein VF666_04000 [Pyrinomonadaceae bacterium]|jgi:hypothetical protein